MPRKFASSRLWFAVWDEGLRGLMTPRQGDRRRRAASAYRAKPSIHSFDDGAVRCGFEDRREVFCSDKENRHDQSKGDELHGPMPVCTGHIWWAAFRVVWDVLEGGMCVFWRLGPLFAAVVLVVVLAPPIPVINAHFATPVVFCGL